MFDLHKIYMVLKGKYTISKDKVLMHVDTRFTSNNKEIGIKTKNTKVLPWA